MAAQVLTVLRHGQLILDGHGQKFTYNRTGLYNLANDQPLIDRSIEQDLLYVTVNPMGGFIYLTSDDVEGLDDPFFASNETAVAISDTPYLFLYSHLDGNLLAKTYWSGPPIKSITMDSQTIYALTEGKIFAFSIQEGNFVVVAELPVRSGLVSLALNVQTSCLLALHTSGCLFSLTLTGATEILLDPPIGAQGQIRFMPNGQMVASWGNGVKFKHLICF